MRRLKRIFFLVCVVSNYLTSQSVTEPSKVEQFNITVNHEDHTIKTQILSRYKKIDVNEDKVYMWYSNQKIMETKGGFDGKLLHGTYRSFYLNDQIKEQGEIHYGLKNKLWKYWSNKGIIRESITWKNGVKNGVFKIYNDLGQLMGKGYFKEDKLNGRFYTYDTQGKVIEKKKYKNGAEVIAKPKRGKTRKEDKVKETKPKKKKKSKEKDSDGVQAS